MIVRRRRREKASERRLRRRRRPHRKVDPMTNGQIRHKWQHRVSERAKTNKPKNDEERKSWLSRKGGGKGGACAIFYAFGTSIVAARKRDMWGKDELLLFRVARNRSCRHHNCRNKTKRFLRFPSPKKRRKMETLSRCLIGVIAPRCAIFPMSIGLPLPSCCRKKV